MAAGGARRRLVSAATVVGVVAGGLVAPAVAAPAQAVTTAPPGWHGQASFEYSLGNQFSSMFATARFFLSDSPEPYFGARALVVTKATYTFTWIYRTEEPPVPIPCYGYTEDGEGNGGWDRIESVGGTGGFKDIVSAGPPGEGASGFFGSGGMKFTGVNVTRRQVLLPTGCETVTDVQDPYYAGAFLVTSGADTDPDPCRHVSTFTVPNTGTDISRFWMTYTPYPGEVIPGCVAADDTDRDGVANPDDNCPTAANTTQADRDGNGTGDACQDGDGDGLTDEQELAIGTNPDLGDSDLDGIPDGVEAPGGSPVDTDGDGQVDALDTDSDNDGLPDSTDPDRLNPPPVTPPPPPPPLPSGGGGGDACVGVTLSEVIGQRPSYLSGVDIAAFPQSQAVCRAWWLPEMSEGFVPQGLALDGASVWVSGYRRYSRFETDSNKHGERCLLQRVSTVTGARTAIVRGIRGTDGTWCQHGGGVALTSHGLWVSDTSRLFLLDPAKVGRGDPVIRTWKLKAPVKGSFLLSNDDVVLGIGVFDESSGAASRIHRFRIRDLLRIADGGRAVAIGGFPVPAKSQGAAAGGGGVWTTSSASNWGRLYRKGGSCVGFLPGAEEIEIDAAGHLWAISEAGARPYHAPAEPAVPALTEFDAAALDSFLGC